MTYSGRITEDDLRKLKKLGLPSINPKSQYVVLHMHGDGTRASTAFNFQVYTGRKGYRLVTNDKTTLDRLLSGEAPIDVKGKRVLLLDDSGWGFPIGGVLCGVYDAETGKFYQREIEVEFFQSPRFGKKEYLERYKERALEIIEKIAPSIGETVIKICTGYINTKAKEVLRERNFYLVEVDKIGEPLQSWLEEQNRLYVERLIGRNLYYDPKALHQTQVPARFHEVVEFAETHNLMHLVKTGWKFFEDRK